MNPNQFSNSNPAAQIQNILQTAHQQIAALSNDQPLQTIPLIPPIPKLAAVSHIPSLPDTVSVDSNPNNDNGVVSSQINNQPQYSIDNPVELCTQDWNSIITPSSPARKRHKQSH